MEPDLTRRFGCMNGGTTDIREHSWFTAATFDWKACACKEAPYEKGQFHFAMRSADDVSAFDDYSTARLPKPRQLKPHEAKQFDQYTLF